MPLGGRPTDSSDEHSGEGGTLSAGGRSSDHAEAADPCSARPTLGKGGSHGLLKFHSGGETGETPGPERRASPRRARRRGAFRAASFRGAPLARGHRREPVFVLVRAASARTAAGGERCSAHRSRRASARRPLLRPTITRRPTGPSVIRLARMATYGHRGRGPQSERVRQFRTARTLCGARRRRSA